MGTWPLPSAGLVLKPRQVHLWQAVLEATPERLLDYWAWLAPDERERAERFHFPEHRDRYAIGRGILRVLLGNYLQVPPSAVRFAYTERGKPYLADGQALAFNVSHSKDRALYGFAWDVELGVDLECLRPMPDAAQLAARFFTPAEAETIAATPERERARAFFRAWTRKEAYLKATGEGIHGLDAVEVAVAINVRPEILAIGGDCAAAAAWSLYHLEPDTEIVAALALGASPAWPLACWQFVAS